MGVSSLFVKLAMADAKINITFLLEFLVNPFAWIAMAVGGTGFLYLQKALYKKNVSSVVPTVSAFSIITPVILSVIFLNDQVSLVNWIGVSLVMFGIIGITRNEKESLLEKIAKTLKI